MNDPENPEAMKPLEKEVTIGEGDQWPVAQRWYALAGKTLKMKVRRGRNSIELEAMALAMPEEGFQYGDKIIATTNPENNNLLDPLPPDPRNPNSDRLDYFAFWRRMNLAAGQFMTVKVKHRGGEEAFVVPPAYTQTFGMKMVMGPITAIRAGSVAEQLGVHEKDILKEVRLTASNDKKSFIVSAAGADPMKLPYEVQDWINAHEDVEVALVVLRHNQDTGQDRAPVTLGPVKCKNEDRYRFSKERPGGLSSALSIPTLGLAYRVETARGRCRGEQPRRGCGLAGQRRDQGYSVQDAGRRRARPRPGGRSRSRPISGRTPSPSCNPGTCLKSCWTWSVPTRRGKSRCR